MKNCKRYVDLLWNESVSGKNLDRDGDEVPCGLYEIIRTDLLDCAFRRWIRTNDCLQQLSGTFCNELELLIIV